MVQDRQALTIRLTQDRHDWLRERAFRHRVSMQQIIDEAVDLLRQTEAATAKCSKETPDA
jgi:hypothetical protein